MLRPKQRQPNSSLMLETLFQIELTNIAQLLCTVGASIVKNGAILKRIKCHITYLVIKVCFF